MIPTRPRDFTATEFRQAIARRLVPEEAKLVINPLDSDLAMRRWARFVTKGATNDYDAAQMLFANLMGRGSANAATSDHPPTAREAYYAWNKPEALFACQDLSFVFVALARECGLHAYHTLVEIDNRGIYVIHGCPAIFIGEKMILADPAYSVFDIHHQKFTVLNDLETAGLYLAEKGQLRPSQIAYKLASKLTIVQQSLFDALTIADRWDEAEKLAAQMNENNPGSPITHTVASKVAEKHGNMKDALRNLRQATALAPDSFEFHFRLASTLMNVGMWRDAKASFESAARYASYAASRDVAFAGAASADALECVARADWENVLINSDRAIALDPSHGLPYTARAAAKAKRGDLAGALSDYSRAVELNPNAAESYYNRANLEYLMDSSSAAVVDLENAIRLNPKLGVSYATLGYVKYDRHDFKDAVANFQKAIKTGPVKDYIHFRVYLARSRLGDVNAAMDDLRYQLAANTNNSSNSWTMDIGKYLLGELSQQALFASADADSPQQASKRCEAWYYCGSRSLLSGDKLTARRCFESCVEMDIPTLMERVSAKAELNQLN